MAQVSGIVSVVTPMNMLVVAPDGSNRRIVSSSQGGFLISTPAWAGKDEIFYVQALTITGGTALPAGGARLARSLSEIDFGEHRINDLQAITY